MILLVIALAVWVYVLSGRIEDLQKKVARLSGEGVYRDIAAATQGDVAVTPQGVAAAATHQDREGSRPEDVPPGVMAEHRENTKAFGIDRFIGWLKKDFMVKLGAFLLLLAFGWFVSYAFANNWIGEFGRISLGVLTGVAFMALGVWRFTTHAHQGGIFVVLGSTTVYLTLWAARGLYDMFTPTTVLLMMALTAVFVAFVSVRYASNTLALVGLILASFAPFLTFAPDPDLVERFTYLTAIVLGTLWVVYLRGWSNLTFASLVIVILYGLPFLAGNYFGGDRDIALLFAFVFTTIFFVANILGLIANESKENAKYHLFIALGTGFYLINWIASAADPEWQSLLYVMWMLVFSVGSFIVYRVLENRLPFYIYGGTSIALLAAATAAELNGPALTIAFTIEVALLVGLAARLLGDVRAANRLAFLFMVPVLMSIESIYASTWYMGIMHDDFFVLFILGSVLALVGFILADLSRMKEKSEQNMGYALITLAVIYGLGLIWLVLHAGTQLLDLGWRDSYDYTSTNTSAYQRATTYSLIIYTIIGLGAYIGGLRNGLKALRIGGAILLGFVVLHLLFVEIWQMDLVWRIITFLIIGSLLVSTAFIRKHKDVSQPIINENIQ